MTDDKQGYTPEAIESETVDRPFRKLDARVIKLWLLSDLIGNSIFVLIALLTIIIWGASRAVMLWWLMGGWMALAAFLLWYSFWRPGRAYRSWGYRINERVLETQSGIVFHRTRLLPLTRLQHVDLERGPLERVFGLASLILHTAGTHSARITVPGLDVDEAVALRDHLVEIGGDDAV